MAHFNTRSSKIENCLAGKLPPFLSAYNQFFLTWKSLPGHNFEKLLLNKQFFKAGGKAKVIGDAGRPGWMTVLNECGVVNGNSTQNTIWMAAAGLRWQHDQVKAPLPWVPIMSALPLSSLPAGYLQSHLHYCHPHRLYPYHYSRFPENEHKLFAYFTSPAVIFIYGIF